MSRNLSLSEFTKLVVNVNENLFQKYQAGITSHFSDYLQKHHPDAVHGDQINLDALNTGIPRLRENYLKKSSTDYSVEDSAALMLTDQDLYTAEYVSAKTIQPSIQEHINNSSSISQVFVKRSTLTGRLLPCVNQEYLMTMRADQALLS